MAATCLNAVLRAVVALILAIDACDEGTVQAWGLGGLMDDLIDLREDLEAGVEAD